MRPFLCRLFWFVLPIVLVLVIGILLPPTPRASTSFLFAGPQKDRLLQETASPRIIFVGGSNLTFGLNCQMIRDSLNLNPINTGLHAMMGLRYMLENTIQYVKEGDIVVLCLEYNQFHRDYNAPSEELMRMVLDVQFSKIKLLSPGQSANMLAFIPKYVLTKLRPSEYRNVKENDIYGVHSFNEFGDVDKHWGKPRVEFPTLNRMAVRIHPGVVGKIREFQARLGRKNATLLIAYPGLQDLSFAKSIRSIEAIDQELRRQGFTILGRPERYQIPDRMMFNTPYHLNKEGVDYRTRLFIEDFQQYRRSKQADNPES